MNERSRQQDAARSPGGEVVSSDRGGRFDSGSLEGQRPADVKRYELSPWERHALGYVRAHPGTLVPSRGALCTGAKGLVRMGLATRSGGYVQKYTLTREGHAEYDRRHPKTGDAAA